MQEQLRDTEIAISNCNAFMLTAIEDFHHPSYIEPNEEYRQRRIDYTHDALRTAAALDAEYISIEPGGPIPEDRSREWGVDVFEESLSAIIPTAENVGVELLIEPEPDLLIETSEQYLSFMDRIDSDYVGCNFDVGHFFCVDEDPTELVDELGEYTTHYHLEDIPADRTHEHTQLGDGALDIDGFLSAVERTGYDGFVTVELYPYEETAAETAREAMAYLDEHGWT